MANWDIKPGAAAGVLQKAGGQASGYSTDINSVSTALGSAATSLSKSPLVLSRLGEYKEKDLDPAMNKVAGHTHSALQGTADAITYYVAGDYEMAATAQRNAAKPTYPTPPGAGGGPANHGQQVPR